MLPTYDIENNENKRPENFASDLKVINLLKLPEELFEDAKIGEIAIIDKLRTLKPDKFSAVTNARDNQGNTIPQIVMNYKKRYEFIASELQGMLETSS